jgi:hypothetical protein|tara:strand:+ start:181 stop:333 length:153 start_codon:yes stop_codon:yes gene_type:complete
MNEKIKEYALKNYPTRFKKEDKMIVEEREKHFVVYAKDKSPVFLSKKTLL